ncbi:MAG: RloB family protein [Firmicutes bacterium]|nr:RloB family protein [Bacillota bacterium]
MRERRAFAERTKVLKSNEAKRKFFLVYEGDKTEAIYFDAVNHLRSQIAINPLIELVPLMRSYSEQGWSNPQKILERLISEIEAEKAGNICCETLLNRIMDYFIEVGIDNSTSKKIIWNRLVTICKNHFEYAPEAVVANVPDTCKTIIEDLRKQFSLPGIVEDISTAIINDGIGFEDGFDKICLIVDRDRNSFTENQYDLVLSKCAEKKIGFFVTNPCFEFWLLLHFDEGRNLDMDKLRENPRVTASKRYVEAELKKLFPHYSKNAYDAGEFVKNVDIAIANEQAYCEDVNLLKDQVGSNVGKLITCLREDYRT